MNKGRKRFLIIAGTRPEAIKLIPVYKELKSRENVEVHLLSTGQHKELIEPLWKLFEIQPDFELNVLEPNQSLASLTSKLINEINLTVTKGHYDCVIVQGDTTSCMVGSLIGFYNKLKVAHVEAGLRTFDKYSPFPEEINRKITSAIADFHFAPTKTAYTNLLNEKVTGEISITGNTGIDSLFITLKMIGARKDMYRKKFSSIHGENKKMVLITGHRRENIGKRFEEIFQAIAELARENPEVNFVYPVHFNPNVRAQTKQWLKGTVNVHLIEPVPYDEMVYLLDSSFLILTDSGGIQEESASLHKPLLILRDTTERPEGVEAGCSILAGVSRDEIKRTFYRVFNDSNLYFKMANVANPFGDGTASVKIADKLLNFSNQKV